MDSQKQELEVLGKTDATSPLITGNHVFDPLTFAPEIVHFSRKQYLFLNHYKLGVALTEAAAKADMTVEQADRFLDKPQTKAWLQDRALMDHIKREWEEPSKWWKEGNDVWEGKRTANKSQMLVWQEFGQRICPKKSVEGPGTTKIEINIDPNAVREAFIRQETIEGEIVNEQKST